MDLNSLKAQLPLNVLKRDVTPHFLAELEAWLEQYFFKKGNALRGYIHYSLKKDATPLGTNAGDEIFAVANDGSISFETSGPLSASTTDGSVTLECNAAVDSLLGLQNNSSVNAGILIQNNGHMANTNTRHNIYINNNTAPATGKKGIKIENDGGGDITIENNAAQITMFANTNVLAEAKKFQFTLDASGNFIILNLPTSDPGVSGALYSSAGTLKISP